MQRNLIFKFQMMDMVTDEDKKTLMARMFDAENEE